MMRSDSRIAYAAAIGLTLAAPFVKASQEAELIPPPQNSAGSQRAPLSRDDFLRYLELNLIDQRDISEAEWHESEVLSAAIKSTRLRDEAFKQVRPQDLNSPLVAGALAEAALSDHVYLPEELNGTAFASKPFLAALAQRISESGPESWLFVQRNLLTAPKNSPAEREIKTLLAPLMADRLDHAFSEALRKDGHARQEFFEILSRVSYLIRLPEIQETIKKQLPSLVPREREALVLGYRAVGTDLDSAIPNPASGEIRFGSTFYQLGSSTELPTEECLRKVHTNGAKALEEVTEEHLKDPRVLSAVSALIHEDVRHAQYLYGRNGTHGCIRTHSGLEDAVSRALESPKNRERIVAEIESDLLALGSYPALVSRVPEIAHAARIKLNQIIARGGLPKSLSGNQQFHFYMLVERHGENIPDIYALEDVKSNRLNLSLLNNPRYFSKWISAQERPSEELSQAWNTVNRVADLLHIHSFYRFDNFRAIVRNRFLIERPEIQEELIKLLGENYFKDVNLDTRPVCLVDYPSPKTDHNDAFLAREQVFLWSDTIDYLTSYYRVIYIEPEWDYDAVEAALRVRNITGTGIPEHIIGGHGSSDGTMFSFRFSGTSNSTNGNFDIKDKPLIAELSHAIAPQGRVIMISCSTAKIDKASGTCIAETLSKALPGRTIIAPSDDAGATLTFNAQGAITGVKYHGARVITYRPDGERESGPYHSAYFIREGFLRVAYNEMKEHPWLIGPVGFFVFWQGVALWRIGASVTKRIRRWVRPESPQEITQEAP